MEPTKEEILKTGFVDVRIRLAGIIQRHRLAVTEERTPYGTALILTTNAKIPPIDLTKLAEQFQLPARSPLGTAFPKGKGIKDFVKEDG